MVEKRMVEKEGRTSDLEASVIESLDAHDRELYDYLPYLLQDFWEIGAYYPDFAALLRRNGLAECGALRVLDLGCGKGAVAIPMAKELGFSVLGIDGMGAFVDEARRRAEDGGVSSLCRFEVGDIRREISNLEGFDIVVLSAIGPILGDYEATVGRLGPCLNPGGCIIVDDAYLREGMADPRGIYHSRNDLLGQLARAGAELVDEIVMASDAVGEMCAEETDWIRRRAGELAVKHPDKAGLFEAYVRVQEEESRVLEEDVMCVLLLIRLKGKRPGEPDESGTLRR